MSVYPSSFSVCQSCSTAFRWEVGLIRRSAGSVYEAYRGCVWKPSLARWRYTHHQGSGISDTGPTVRDNEKEKDPFDS